MNVWVTVAADPDACNYSEEGISDESLCSYITLYDITGNAEPFSQNIQDYTYTNTAGSSYEWTATGGDIVGGQGDNVVSVVWNVEAARFACWKRMRTVAQARKSAST